MTVSQQVNLNLSTLEIVKSSLKLKSAQNADQTFKTHKIWNWKQTSISLENIAKSEMHVSIYRQD